MLSLSLPYILLSLFLTFSGRETSLKNPDSQAGNRYLQAKIEKGCLTVHWNHFPFPFIEKASCGITLNGGKINGTDYPSISVSKVSFRDHIGRGTRLIAAYEGLPGKPDLNWIISLYEKAPWLTIRLEARNPQKDSPLLLTGLFPVSARGEKTGCSLLVKEEHRYRVLSETFHNTWEIDKTLFLSPQHPLISSVWLQMLSQTGKGPFFLTACLEAHRFITVIKTGLSSGSSDSSSGQLPLKWEIAQFMYPPDLIKGGAHFQLELQPGGSCSSETIFLGAGSSWPELLETYAGIFQDFNKIEITDENPMVFCSWTPYYRSVTEELILKNARFVSKYLKQYGYNIIQVDGVGWPAARGDYLHSNPKNFPHGMEALSREVRGLALNFGIWLAILEVSEHSSLYHHHRDWLLKDSSGLPVPGRDISQDRGYILDNTNPEAREFLRKECRDIQSDLGCRYFKLDYLETAVRAGNRFNNNVTPLEAMRQGLKDVREAIGADSFIVAGAAPAWAVAGMVDACRAGPDIAHEWAQIKQTADSIASRYYLHRRFFILDPDAAVAGRRGRPKGILSRNFTADPITLEEARVSVTVAALSGGLLQLGDDLPELYTSPERYALITNRDIIDINRKRKIARPVDLMSFKRKNEIPSFWHIRENRDRHILAIFNWQDAAASFSLPLHRLGLSSSREFTVQNIWEDNKRWGTARGMVEVPSLQPHSVLLLRLFPSESLHGR